jgi:hypothetical protein
MTSCVQKARFVMMASKEMDIYAENYFSKAVARTNSDV